MRSVVQALSKLHVFDEDLVQAGTLWKTHEINDVSDSYIDSLKLSPFMDSFSFSVRAGSYNGPKSKRATTHSMKML